MLRVFALAAVAMVTLAPVRAQKGADDSPVHVVLRLAGERSNFKSGEPIRLELVFTATRPGFTVDSAGLDRAEEEMRVIPADGVTRFPTYSWRDYSDMTPLSETPIKLPLVANYWMRFDRAGDYTISVTTKRVRRAGRDGWSGIGEGPIPLTPDPVRIHVDLPSVSEEQVLMGNAIVALQGASPQNLNDQIHAAEQLAFLAGDEAALEKYRQYRSLDPRLSNARSILRRGFFMSKNPALILHEVERELDDVTKPATWDEIADAMALRDAVENRPQPPSAMVLPLPPDDGAVDPYVERVRASLDGRRGESRRVTALTLFANWGRKWPDVRDIVASELMQFSPATRQWLLTTFADDLRLPSLAEAIVATIEQTAPNERRELLAQLAKVDPPAAVAPLLQAIGDPSVSMLYDVAEKMPAGSLAGATRGLMDVIEKLLAKRTGRDFTLEQKVVLLPIVADGSIVEEVKALYDTHAKDLDHESRAGLLGYLLKWDDSEAMARIKSALDAPEGVSLVDRATQYAYSPALDPIVQDWLFGDDIPVASKAAHILQRAKRPNLRNIFETRLNSWRDQRRRTISTLPPTQAEGWFESQLVREIYGWPAKLPAAELDALRASCLTNQCRLDLK